MILQVVLLLAICVSEGHEIIPLVIIPRGQSMGVIPCVGLEPDVGVTLLYWYKGENSTELNLLVRYAQQNIGENYTVSDRYSITPEFSLVIADVDSTDGGGYWCRFVSDINGNEQFHRVNLVVTVVPRAPTISPCDSTNENSCRVMLSERLVVDCTVKSAYPSPDLDWSSIDCDQRVNNAVRWFTSRQTPFFDSGSETYDVTVSLSLAEVQLEDGDTCSLECVASGDAIVANQSSSILTISGKVNNASSGSSNAGLIVVIVILAILLLISVAVIVYRHRMGKYQLITKQKVPEDDVEIKATPCKDIFGKSKWTFLQDLTLPDAQSEECEVKGVAPLDGDGLAVATKSSVHFFSSQFELQNTLNNFERGSITSIVKRGREREEHLVACLTKAVCIIRVKVLSVKYCSSLPNFDKNSLAVIDDSGIIFWGLAGTTIIYKIENNKFDTKRHNIDTTMENIAIYQRNKETFILVNNGGQKIQKYIKTCPVIENILTDISLVPFSISPSEDIPKLGNMAVHRKSLYIITGNGTISRYYVETGALLQTYRTEMTDLVGLCFFGKCNIALYGGNWVKIYKSCD